MRFTPPPFTLGNVWGVCATFNSMLVGVSNTAHAVYKFPKRRDTKETFGSYMVQNEVCIGIKTFFACIAGPLYTMRIGGAAILAIAKLDPKFLHPIVLSGTISDGRYEKYQFITLDDQLPK